MFYGSKLIFRDGEILRVNLLIQKPNVRVIKEGFGWLERDIILKEDVKKMCNFLRKSDKNLAPYIISFT